MKDTLRLLLVSAAIAAAIPLNAQAQTVQEPELDRHVLPDNGYPSRLLDDHRGNRHGNSFEQEKYGHNEAQRHEYWRERSADGEQWRGRRAHYGNRRHKRLERFLRRFDQNGDGKITRQEFAEILMRRFYKFDTNRDGTITSEELASRRDRS